MHFLSNNYFSEMNLKGILYVLGLLIISGVNLEAQQKQSFKTNGKKVDIESFNQEVRQMMGDVGIPSLSVAIIEDNKIAYHHSYGIKQKGEKAKVNKRTVFQGCSLSKSFLVFVAHQLRDEGILDLDKPMYQYLPYSRLEYDPRYKLITARMVLSHSSGLENWQMNFHPDTLEIVNEPGKTYLYSGEGYNYLAMVIDHLLGQDYVTYTKERVIKPLGLKNSYLTYRKKFTYPLRRFSPWNFTVGHGVFGGFNAYINYFPQPAFGNSFTAEDYAKLIIATFDNSQLSITRRNELKEPVVKIAKQVHYGPGFQVIYAGGDTLIAQGGNNAGYKNWMFYSAVNKRGIVYMTSSDRGELIAEKLVQMTVGFDMNPWKASWPGYQDQYPSTATKLLKLYDDKGLKDMNSELKNLAKKGQLKSSSINTLADMFNDGGKDSIAISLLNRPEVDPNTSYYQLGIILFFRNRHKLALEHLTKAKSYNSGEWDFDLLMRKSKEAIEQQKIRESFLTHIKKNETTTIEAENYNVGKGIMTGVTEDETGKRNVGGFDSGEWMDFNIDVLSSGTYATTFRITSGLEGNQLDIFSGEKLIRTVDIQSTGGWQNWVSVEAPIDLPKGPQRLRLAVRKGAIGINWMKFSPASETER